MKTTAKTKLKDMRNRIDGLLRVLGSNKPMTSTAASSLRKLERDVGEITCALVKHEITKDKTMDDKDASLLFGLSADKIAAIRATYCPKVRKATADDKFSNFPGPSVRGVVFSKLNEEDQTYTTNHLSHDAFKDLLNQSPEVYDESMLHDFTRFMGFVLKHLKATYEGAVFGYYRISIQGVGYQMALRPYEFVTGPTQFADKPELSYGQAKDHRGAVCDFYIGVTDHIEDGPVLLFTKDD